MIVGHCIIVSNKHGLPIHTETVRTAEDAHERLVEWLYAIGLDPMDTNENGYCYDAVYSMAEYGNPRPTEVWQSENGTTVSLQPIVLEQ